MRNKELIERIEKLEVEVKVAKRTKEVLDFVLESGKDGVLIGDDCKGWGIWAYSLTYIYNTQLKCCHTNLFSHIGNDIKIIKVDNMSIIFSFGEDYYKVDKAKATYMQIPEPLFVSKDKEKQTKAKKKNANT